MIRGQFNSGGFRNTRVYIRIYIHIWICVDIYTHMHICICIYVYVCVCVYTDSKALGEELYNVKGLKNH